jgi:hypothetical protein
MSEQVGPSNRDTSDIQSDPADATPLETNSNHPDHRNRSVNTDPVENPAIDRDIFCQTCGYNLRGLTSNRCPECGSSFEHIRGGDPEIPWMYRRRLGWFRAYWKTVFFVMFKQARFADEMARPVSFKESQSFRWVTVIMAFVPVASLTVIGLIGSRAIDLSAGSSLGVATTIGLLIAGAAGVFLVFAGATGVPSYFYHPKAVSILQQNRAIALSYYACGPLSLLGIPGAVFLLGAFLGPDHRFGGLLMLVGLTVPMGLLSAWWLDLIHLSRRLLPQRPGRAVGIAILVPMLWCFVACVSLFALPALVISAIIISRSLA